MNTTYIILGLFTIGVLVVPHAEAQKQFESLFGQIPEQTITLEISAGGNVHVIHDVSSGPSSTRYVEFIQGNTSNVEVHDKNGEEIGFGMASLGDVGGVQLFTSSPLLIEYDLDEALEFRDGIWYWNYQYIFGNALFILPDEVNFVYVNDRYIELGDAKGLNCHGCGAELAFYFDKEPTIKNIEWESEKFPVEIISQNKINNFDFIQQDKVITFETENPQIVTLTIPLKLLWNPYQVYFIEDNEDSSFISPQNAFECNETQDKITIQGTASCFSKIYNNEIEIDQDNVRLTVHPPKAGTIIILGTSAIPEFPVFIPLMIGLMMVILLQFRNKINFSF